MSTVTIQRIPKAGGDPVTKTLAEWGLAVGTMDSAAWVIGTLTLTARGSSPAFADPVFEYLDTLKVFEDETCIWWGPCISTGSTVQPAQQRTYTIADPLWWAQWQPFVWPFTPEPEHADTERGSWWLGWALSQIADEYPVAYVSDDFTAFSAPCPDLRASATCLELIQRVARLHPMSAQWWDLSGTAPVLRCALRSGLAAVDLARSRCQEPIQLTPLHDQQLTGVRVEYRFTNSFGQRSSVVDDAGTGPFEGANKILCALKVGTDNAADGAANYDAAYDAAAYNIAALLYAARSALPWAGSLTIVGTPANPLPTIRPGQLLNLTGGRTDWASMAAQVQRVSRTCGETCERMSVELGCGEHLGPTDLLSLARAGGVSGGAAGGNPAPWDNPTPPPPPGDDNSVPGTYDDLNGTTGGGTPEGIVAVQARGTIWSLIGHAAYVGEPTRRWRLRTFGGSRTGYSGSTGCAGMSVSGAAQQAGTQYVEDNGSVTSTALVTPTAGDGLGYAEPTAITNAYGLCPSSEGTGYCRTTTITATLVSTVGVGGGGSGCCTTDGTVHYGYAGTTTAELSAEDLPPAAIGRMLATAEWGEATTAIQTIPTTGITGLYREARYRTEHTETAGGSRWMPGYYMSADGTVPGYYAPDGAWVPPYTASAGQWVPGHFERTTTAATYPTLIGLTPWQRYQLTVTLESRPVDSAGAPTGDGAWSAAGTRQHYFVADLTGEGGIDWQVIEPTAGYETRIASTLVEAA